MHLQTDPESLVPDPVSPPSFLRRWHLLIMQHAVCFVPHVYVRSWWEALPCVRAERGGEGVCSVLVLMRVSCHRICLGSHPLLRAHNFHLHVCLCSYFHCWCTFLWETVKMYAQAAERGRNFIIVTFVGCWLYSKGWVERFLFSYRTFKKWFSFHSSFRAVQGWG